MNKPKPLDLEGAKTEILDEFARRICNPPCKTYKELLNWCGTGDETEPLVVDISIQKIRQHIKSACNFYLKYKDKPTLFVMDYEEYEEEVYKLDTGGYPPQDGEYLTDTIIVSRKVFNDWLFKLTFNGRKRGE